MVVKGQVHSPPLPPSQKPAASAQAQLECIEPNNALAVHTLTCCIRHVTESIVMKRVQLSVVMIPRPFELQLLACSPIPGRAVADMAQRRLSAWLSLLHRNGS